MDCGTRPLESAFHGAGGAHLEGGKKRANEEKKDGNLEKFACLRVIGAALS